MPRHSPLDDLLNDDASTVITDSKTVPNQQPLLSGFAYRIAIIGEAPGVDELRDGKPFVGLSGRFLTGLLSRVNIARDACFIGNICQHRPPGNDISSFPRDGQHIQDGLRALSADLEAFNPNVCLLLGGTALWAALDTDKIGNWRGSVFIGNRPGPFLGRKCIASYHPAACLRQYEWTPQLMFDIKKARLHAERPDLVLPERDLLLPTDASEIVNRLQSYRSSRQPIAIDIEGYVDAMKCISVANSPFEGICVPFTKLNGDSYWDSLDDEVAIWRSLSGLLMDPLVPKILQNSLYDRFVLQYSYGIIVRGVADDTMLKHWELYCEMEKSLGFMASIYTDEPFYKFERKAGDLDTFLRYCIKDSCITYEINSKVHSYLGQCEAGHYRFNVSLLNPILYMENRGIRYDSNRAAKRLEEVNAHIYQLQAELDEASGFGIKRTATRDEVQSAIMAKFCYKRSPGQFKKDCEAPGLACFEIARRWPDVSPQDLGQLNTLLKTGLNIKSADFKTYVYETLKCPKQYDPKSGSLTTDYEALLKIWKKTSLAPINLAIQIGNLRTRAQMLAISADSDGRVRAGYNVVGSETGRITCYTSPTGSGYNLQTIPSEDKLKPSGHPLRSGMRDLFIADDGYYLFQCDLSGADSWTVAARLASLGDPTMLDDLRAGIKPAKVLAYMLEHGPRSLAGLARSEVKRLSNTVDKDSWQYFACKVGIHMTSYRGGPRKLADVILIQSEGAVTMSESEVKELQNLVFIRYHVKLWWNWMEQHLSRQPYPPRLVSPSGHIRRFFGRREEIIGEALAHEPQSVTTYATNKAMQNLWRDPENRIEVDSKLRFRIEPLHQVHDALLGQFRVEDTAWATSKIESYFRNPITIAGVTFTIPYEGNLGPSWGQLDVGKI